MAFMEHAGIRFYYEDSGGDQPVLLFLHGAGGNHLSWWQQVPVFADEYRCVSMDQRGFGQSPDAPGGPGPAALATDALALLDHLGIVRAGVVAQSMGGWAAVGAITRAPGRFWAVVLANTVGNLTNPTIAARRQELVAASPPRPAILWHGALGPTFRRNDPVRSFLYASIAGLNQPLATDFRDRMSALTTPVERYAAANIPTLFLTSEEDGLIWPQLSETVHQHVPGSSFVRVAGAGHSTYFERPDVFNREVAAFLKPHRPS
jgi:3-oxoadipate enol-lactonase